MNYIHVHDYNYPAMALPRIKKGRKRSQGHRVNCLCNLSDDKFYVVYKLTHGQSLNKVKRVLSDTLIL